MSDYTIQTQIQELKQEQQASKVQLANIEAAIHKLELMLIESENKHSLTELKVSNLESSITNISLDTRSIRNSVISGIILATIIGLGTMAIQTFRTEPHQKTIIKTSTSLLSNKTVSML